MSLTLENKERKMPHLMSVPPGYRIADATRATVTQETGWNKNGTTFTGLEHSLIWEYYSSDDEPVSDIMPELDGAAFRAFQLSELES